MYLCVYVSRYLYIYLSVSSLQAPLEPLVPRGNLALRSHHAPATTPDSSGPPLFALRPYVLTRLGTRKRVPALPTLPAHAHSLGLAALDPGVRLAAGSRALQIRTGVRD